MEYYPFPALLLSSYNPAPEYGRATLGSSNSIDFSSEFVPLLPLGVDATIEWTLGEKRLASFSGSVYLSSPQLLQLVDIDEKQLAAARNIFAVNTRLPAHITVREKGRIAPHQIPIPVEILYLTQNTLKLRTSAGIMAGESLLLHAQVEFLTLCELPLQVEERVLLRKGEALLLCSIRPGGDENFIALSTYAARLAAAQVDKE